MVPLERKYNVVCGGIGVLRTEMFRKLLKPDPTTYKVKEDFELPLLTEIEAAGIFHDQSHAESRKFILESFRLRGTREEIKTNLCKYIDKICDNIDPHYEKEDIDDQERIANKSW